MSIDRAPLHLQPRAEELRAAGAAGFVLVLPGGGYARRAEHEGAAVADFLAAAGVPAAHLDYPVAPARYPEALEAVLLAMADLRAGVHGLLTGPLAVVGFSAGGHLAGSAATATEAERAGVADRAGLEVTAVRRPDLVTLGYPVTSLVNRAHIGSRLNLLGPDAPEDLAAALSLERRADADLPPLLCWHTADDAAVPVHNSLLTAAAWRARRWSCTSTPPDGTASASLLRNRSRSGAGPPPGWRGWSVMGCVRRRRLASCT